jgi:hypothetical protein
MNSSRRLPPDFSESAAYPLYAIDPAQDRAWVLHFEREDYARASFLDQRALRHREISGWTVSGTELSAALQPAASLARLHWLFHIGHCGSTLASRLLDLVPGTLGLREPLPLLTLAHGRRQPLAGPWLSATRHLLARGFTETRAVVVKPTSVVTTLADQLLPDTGQACLLWVDLQTWLATMLRDADLVQGTLATEDLRLAGIDTSEQASGPGVRLARLWLAEQLRWSRLKQRSEFAPRLLDLDFAGLLKDPAAGTRTLAGHFGLVAPEDLDARIAASGVLDRYAKDASQPFDARTRRHELLQASERHAADITEGLAWAGRELRRQEAAGLEARLRPAA